MAQIADYTSYFNRIKKVQEWWAILEIRQASVADNKSLPYMRNDIWAEFEGDAATLEVVTLGADIDRIIASYDTFKQRLINYLQNILTTIGEELQVTDPTNINQVLDALFPAMEADAEDVKTIVPIINTADVSAANLIKAAIVPFTNLGTGGLIYTFAQPDWQTPGERALVEFIQCECTNTRTNGREQFALSGSIKNSIINSAGQGSGRGPKLTASGTSIKNGTFENWTNLAADNWTILDGDWGTDVLKETTKKYRGTYALKIVPGDGIITQLLSPSLQPNQMYAIGAWFRKDATAANNIVFTITDSLGVQEIDYLESADKLTLDVSTLDAANFEWRMFIFATQGRIERDWYLTINTTALITAAVYMDAIQIIPLTQFNDIWWGIYSGDIDFGLGDNFGSAGIAAPDHNGIEIEHTTTSTLHSFLIRILERQFPSDGTPTITD